MREADSAYQDALGFVPRCNYRFKPLNSTMSVAVVVRAMARRVPSREQAASAIWRSSVKCVSDVHTYDEFRVASGQPSGSPDGADLKVGSYIRMRRVGISALPYFAASAAFFFAEKLPWARPPKSAAPLMSVPVTVPA